MRTRSELILEIKAEDVEWDVIVIGGGASGLGAALDASARGYKTVLLEQFDFTVGTSSRSTKLVHGGVRYLAQGNISLVFEALKERGRLLKNAPHLVYNQEFLIPSYCWWSRPFYTIGLTLYDLLARSLSYGRSIPYSRKKTLEEIPTLKKEGLRGSVKYHDGQFDDSRLGINLAQTMIEKNGVPLNYMKVIRLIKDEGKIAGVVAVDYETKKEYHIKGKSVLNATGVFVDHILQKDEPNTNDMVMASQGVHLVLGGEFLQSKHAIMIPKTSDGRILFAVPWHQKVILGTTDIPKEEALIEPIATDEEIDFILETAGRYLSEKPKRKDVLSVYAGLRPLAAPEDEEEGGTKEISRSHKILVSKSGLVTIIGGKWTTYRQMGEELVDKLSEIGNLKMVNSTTSTLKIHGYRENVNFENPHYFYGSDIDLLKDIIDKNPSYGDVISEDLHIIKAQVILAIRNELARNVIDVLARRTRALFLNAKESVRIAPIVADIMAVELNRDKKWKEHQIKTFNTIAQGYILN